MCCFVTGGKGRRVKSAAEDRCSASAILLWEVESSLETRKKSVLLGGGASSRSKMTRGGLRHVPRRLRSTVYDRSFDPFIHEEPFTTMSSNVGLTTPRGSGTSGYVQRNLSLLKPRDQAAPYTKDYDQIKQHRHRQPDKDILEHDRKREIEVKVFELRDRLEDEGYVETNQPTRCARHANTIFCSVDEDEIDDQCDAFRKKLQKEADTSNERLDKAKARNLKQHQVHELAAAKIEESEKLRKALGISEDYEEGSHWRKQEERLRDAMKKEAGDDLERVREEDRRRVKREDSE